MYEKISELHPNPSEFCSSWRDSSPKTRQSRIVADEFCGLEQDAKPYELLLLVKRVGSSGGFTSRMVHLLEYYMAFTRAIDWQDGQYPIVYQSLSKTAMDLGISERQVQRLEKALADVGALTWQDSGNFRRYGQRCAETGEILYACGVNLAPLAQLEERLRRQLAQKSAASRAWHQTKCRISQSRRKIRAAIEELSGEANSNCRNVKSILGDGNELHLQIRTHMSLDALLSLLSKHEKMLEALRGALKSASSKVMRCGKNIKMSFRNAVDVAYFKYTNSSKFLNRNTGKAPLSCFQGVQVEKLHEQSLKPEPMEPPAKRPQISDTGIQYVTVQQALGAASERFFEFMPMSGQPVSWADIVEAAYRLRRELGISQRFWGEACSVMGRSGAAISILLTDCAVQRRNDRVRKPAGYFRAMVNRATVGELHLHKSIFGILSRESGESGVNAA